MSAAAESERAARAAGRRWTAAILGLLGLVVGAHVLLVAYALGDPSFVAEPDYYAKAVAWDARMAQERHNEELGWGLGVEARPAGVARELIVRLHDRGGAPLVGAEVRLEAFHKARAAAVVRATLSPTAPGDYAATLPLERAGLWELRLVVRRGAETFTARVDRELPPLEGGS